MSEKIPYEPFAERIAKEGIVSFKPTPLAHQRGRGGPLSPIYFNFRKLDPELVREFGGRLLYALIREGQLRFDAVASVPWGADELARALAHSAEVPLLLLEKEESGRRRVLPKLRANSEAKSVRRPAIALLVEDVVTAGYSSLQAVSALRSLGYLVRDALTIVDREQGGRLALQEVDVRLHAVWPISKLLQFYRDRDLISQTQFQEIMSYIRSSSPEL